ncbi:hypothetical protein AB0B45_46405 [Nonomuraea sp. NPDC049152]|uniref:hypothetical protein n=1 Tax=Nonomuraea sp. NPDC049152 TaxID=3154350 RepID=UPI0033E670F7
MGAQIFFSRRFGDNLSVNRSLWAPAFDRLFAAQLGADRAYPEFLSSVSGAWVEPGPDGGVFGSPRTYHAAYFVPQRMVTEFQRTPAPDKFAAVRVDYARQTPGSTGRVFVAPMPGDTWIPTWGEQIGFGLPFTQTAYLNTDDGVRWVRMMQETSADGRPHRTEGRPTTYRAGRTTIERWNLGVFGPAYDPSPTELTGLSRTGDTIDVRVRPLGDHLGRPGFGPGLKVRSALYRDGTLVTEKPTLYPSFTVPPDRATYRVETQAVRGEPYPSTRVSSAWTFRSEHVTGPAGVRLPAAVIGFTPPLSRENTAPGAVPYFVPVIVRQTPESGADQRLKDLSVEVSYDDGATWRTPKLVRTPTGGVVRVDNPASGHVSLRAKATDASGNTVEQTIIRAYRTTGG